MLDNTVLEALFEALGFVFIVVVIPMIILYLFYFVVQQIRFWKGMRRMKFKRFLEILLKNIGDED